MLVFMFVVMLFSPNDDNFYEGEESGQTDSGNVEELVTDIGEIGRDFAAAVAHLEQLGSMIQEMLKNENLLITSIKLIAESSAQGIQPNPQMLETMKMTNVVLSEFKSTVAELNTAAAKLKTREIENRLRKKSKESCLINIQTMKKRATNKRRTIENIFCSLSGGSDITDTWR